MIRLATPARRVILKIANSEEPERAHCLPESVAPGEWSKRSNCSSNRRHDLYIAMDGLIAATAPPEHIAPLVDLEKMRRDGFLILPVRIAAALPGGPSVCP